MIEVRFNNVNIRVNGSTDTKKRECWLTSTGYNEQESLSVAKAFCKKNKMIMLSHRMAKPYECHTWQHSEMFVFEVECTSATSVFYYDFGKW